MKNKYIAPNITVVDLEIESQILTASQVPVDFDNSGDYNGNFNSSNHIFVFDDEELEQD